MSEDVPVTIEESERMAAAAGLPREPFGYLRRPRAGLPGPANPAGLFLFGGILFAFFTIFAAVAVTGPQIDPMAVAAALAAGTCAGSVLWMGARRLQWKRSFLAATGRRPW